MFINARMFEGVLRDTRRVLHLSLPTAQCTLTLNVELLHFPAQLCVSRRVVGVDIYDVVTHMVCRVGTHSGVTKPLFSEIVSPHTNTTIRSSCFTRASQ